MPFNYSEYKIRNLAESSWDPASSSFDPYGNNRMGLDREGVKTILFRGRGRRLEGRLTQNGGQGVLTENDRCYPGMFCRVRSWVGLDASAITSADERSHLQQGLRTRITAGTDDAADTSEIAYATGPAATPAVAANYSQRGLVIAVENDYAGTGTDVPYLVGQRMQFEVFAPGDEVFAAIKPALNGGADFEVGTLLRVFPDGANERAGTLAPIEDAVATQTTGAAWAQLPIAMLLQRVTKEASGINAGDEHIALARVRFI